GGCSRVPENVFLSSPTRCARVRIRPSDSEGRSFSGDSMPLDPDAAAFLKRLAEVHAPPTHEMSPADARSLLLPMAGLREQVGGIESFNVDTPDGAVP